MRRRKTLIAIVLVFVAAVLFLAYLAYDARRQAEIRQEIRFALSDVCAPDFECFAGRVETLVVNFRVPELRRVEATLEGNSRLVAALAIDKRRERIRN